MAAYTSDLEHYRIEAKVVNNHVEETYHLSDTAKGIQAEPTTKIWTIGGRLGRGGYGEVKLHSYEQQKRAVKRIEIPSESAKLDDHDYIRELKALLEFSKPKVSYHLRR
jgi:hypothetical protein